MNKMRHMENFKNFMLKMHQSKDIHPEIIVNGAAGKFFSAIRPVEARRRAHLTVIWALLNM